MKIARIVRESHKGLGLLIGIQVLLWITGGFVMSILPLEKVRGEDWMAESRLEPVPVTTKVLSATEAAVAAGLKDLESAEFRVFLGRPVYLVDASHLIDAADGTVLSPLDEARARAVAIADYAGPGQPTGAVLVSDPATETRGRDLPLWKITFDDARNTTLYISPQSGEVVARRNKLWRIFDFFWMLHVMDYSGRDNFNHPLLIICAAVAWILATTGIWLVVQWVGRRRRKPAR